MTIYSFLGKARRKILQVFLGRNLYASNERVNTLECLTHEAINRMTKLENSLRELHIINEQNNFPGYYTNNAWDSLNGFGPYPDSQPAVDPDISDGLEKHIQRVSFEISNLCNYSSIHKNCPVSWYKLKHKLDSEIVYKVINELANFHESWNGFIAFHRYNEPLLNKELLCTYIEYVNKILPNAKIFILTNGYYLYQEDLVKFEQYKIYCIVVSSYNHQEHNRLIKLQTSIPYQVFHSELDDRKNIYTREPYNLELPCFPFLRDLTINCYGQLSLCCLDWDNQVVFGDLYESTLTEILNSDKLVQIYKELIRGERKLDICKRCNWQR